MHKKGFDIVELVILLATLFLVFGAVVLEVNRHRRYSNESAAIITLRSIGAAIEGYKVLEHSYRGASLKVLTEHIPPLIDFETATGLKNGYAYILKVEGNGHFYYVDALPLHYRVTGERSFRMDQSGKIRALDKKGKPLLQKEGKVVR